MRTGPPAVPRAANCPTSASLRRERPRVCSSASSPRPVTGPAPRRLDLSLANVAAWTGLFLPMAALGTVAHESAHWAAARALGCAPVLHFASTTSGCGPAGAAGLLVTAAGPLQTMLTGSLGLAGLWALRARPWGRGHMIALLLAFFWTRQPFNTSGLLLLSLGPGGAPARLLQGDEQRLSAALGLPPLTLAVATGLLGLAAAGLATAAVPRAQRSAFALGAILGALFGFALWMQILGPALLP